VAVVDPDAGDATSVASDVDSACVTVASRGHFREFIVIVPVGGCRAETPTGG
jgi:hypothetical protein